MKSQKKDVFLSIQLQTVLYIHLCSEALQNCSKFGGWISIFVELLHSTSVQNMGNYQEYVKRLPPPMREIETQPARQHTFGNPFKVNKVTKRICVVGIWIE